MIGLFIFGAVDLALGLIEGGVKVYGRVRKIWRTVSPPKAAPVPGQLSYRDVETQRAQMRAATSQGTVTGPAPITVRSSTILPPPLPPPSPGRD